jgi:hypothetical protein
MMNPDDFPTLAEFAAALRTSERNVRRAAASGGIPVIRISERVVRVNLAQFIGKSGGGAASATAQSTTTPLPDTTPDTTPDDE